MNGNGGLNNMDIEFPEFYERKRIKEAGGAGATIEQVNQAINRHYAGLMSYSQRAMTTDEQLQLRVGMAGGNYYSLLGEGVFGWLK